MGLGTWAWGNQFLWGYEEKMDGELQELFNYALSKDVSLFDTADSYVDAGTGRLNGRSEQLLGRFIAESPTKRRDDVLIATKFAAYPWRVTPGQYVSACRGSLRRLGLNQLALGQLHWSVAKYAPPLERALWDGLAAIYDEGLVKAVGVSNYGPRQLEKIHTYLTDRGVPLASAQVQFSLLSKGPQQQDIKDVCQALGIQLIAYSPLGLGMLTGKYSATGRLPKGPRGLLFRQILPGIQPLLNTMQAIADERNKSVSQVAVNWCIVQGTIPIPGAKTLKHAKDNIGSLGWSLKQAEVDELNSLADSVPQAMVQNVFQTK
ncbi:Aldo/keto reductase [Coccomyxa subellipsoidea C-169]|uniref:Aldo/keto reductase n=1 Tax=Coccomyxa subellipsoidea (strain C-169) TaxID=574566 RepID=I0Z2C4_COCSC|nr:Aldo/keto reductase [Coccomyxa subellipsoidea C-169]EIE24793.1 Aldo/keto reductase [Coccomyxa subellipsoidea C-169]|eukprot:XP_005649337.1 Aldo/keto reductase [Coccomyxa subellipsoidea C-169]